MNDIFSIIYDKYKIDKPIRLIELFGGIGAQAKALENIKANFKAYKYCDFDKFACCSYNAIHNTNFAPSDITKISGKDLEIVDKDKYVYICTYSFPCTDLSSAGTLKGMSEGSGTRSSLLWEVKRILNELKSLNQLPQILLMENVPEVIGQRNIKDFEKWYHFLANLGYSSYYKVLNAKDFGIPQNRKRCFMISFLGNYSYQFPGNIPLKLKLKDMLEKNVDERFYLSPKKVHSIANWKAQQDLLKDIDKEKIISPTLTARGAGEEHSGMVLINEEVQFDNNVVGKESNNSDLKEQLCNTLIENNLVKENDVIRHSYTNNRLNNGIDNMRRIQNKNNNLSPTLDTRCDCLDIVVRDFINENNKNAKHQQDLLQSEEDVCRTIPAGVHGSTPHLLKTVVSGEPFICASRGRNPENPNDRTSGVHTEQRLEVNSQGIANTLTTVQKDNYVVEAKVLKEGNYAPSGHNASCIVNVNGIAPTVMENHGTVTAIKEPNYVGTFDYTKSDNFLEGKPREKMNNEIISTIKTNGGDEGVIENKLIQLNKKDENGKRPSLQDRIYSDSGIATTVTTSFMPNYQTNLRIRKLTPKECYRLMGFTDEDFIKAKQSLNNTFYKGKDKSDAQLYKQAGNSIVVQVLMAIFKQLF